MKYILIFLKVIFFSIFFTACSDDDMQLPKNQIGVWEGMRLARLYQDSITISIDTFPISITLRNDGTGIFDDDKIVDWYIERSSQSDRDNLMVERENNNEDGTINGIYPIMIDEFDYQEWSYISFFPVTSNHVENRWILNRVE